MNGRCSLRPLEVKEMPLNQLNQLNQRHEQCKTANKLAYNTTPTSILVFN